MLLHLFLFHDDLYNIFLNVRKDIFVCKWSDFPSREVIYFLPFFDLAGCYCVQDTEW